MYKPANADLGRSPGRAEFDGAGPRILLLSTADWNAPLWTNKQYMASELASAYRVEYVESLGLRRPELSRRDIARVTRRAGRVLRGAGQSAGRNPRQKPEHLNVLSPAVLPYHRGLPGVVNRCVLRGQFSDWRRLPREQRVLWTYTPTTYGLEAEANVVVYHCVDLLQAFPGIDPLVVARGEKRLAEAGALAIASSREVAIHLREVGFTEVLLWNNVADVDVFSTGALTAHRDARLVVFGGNLSPHKIDCSLVRGIVQHAPDARIVLAGPVAEGGGAGWSDLGNLQDLGVEMPGRVSLDELGSLYRSASVGIVPYLLNGYTRGVNPLKLNEYLGAGLPVVASMLPSLDPIGSDVVLARSPQEFGTAVAAMLGRPSLADIERRIGIADLHSWGTRGTEARSLLLALMARRDSMRPADHTGKAA
jgi:teichuronic acid biosynthesis glycosyltransferase TuaH